MKMNPRYVLDAIFVLLLAFLIFIFVFLLWGLDNV